jgi:hypothetical protein
MRFDVIDRPQHAALEQIGNGEKIAVPAAVVKHAQLQAALFRLRHQRLRLGHRHGKRLVDHHVLAGAQRGQSQRIVRFVRRGDDDEIDRGVFDQRVGRGVDRHLGKRAGDSLAPAAGDACQLQARLGRDQRRMECGAGSAIADQAGTYRLHRMA